MAEKLIFEKIVDKSALSDGITIPLAYHEALYAHLNRRLQRGESMPVQLRMNGTVYTVQLKNQSFDAQKYNRSDILQIRYSRKSPIAGTLRTVFSQTREKVDLNTAARMSGERIILPAKEQEYIMIYAAQGQPGLLLEPVTAGDLSQEMDQLHVLPEMMIEEMLSADENAGIDEKVRLTKVRRMNRAIGDALKALYGYRCQICGAFIGESYGAQVIRAHHIDYFSRSMNNDASNIMIVCPNHHAVIHDRNPEFNVRNKTYRYPNGFVEGLVLNQHL